MEIVWNGKIYELMKRFDVDGRKLIIAAAFKESEAALYVLEKVGDDYEQVGNTQYVNGIAELVQKNREIVKDMKCVYTMRDWEFDGTFACEPEGEVSRAVYEEFLNILPPLHFPRKELEKRGAYGGFLCSEFVGKGMCRGFYTKNGRYYHAGLIELEE